MKAFLKISVIGFFVAVITGTIFVKAGQGGGESGGKQTAQIAKGLGDGLSSLAKGLQGG